MRSRPATAFDRSGPQAVAPGHAHGPAAEDDPSTAGPPGRAASPAEVGRVPDPDVDVIDPASVELDTAGPDLAERIADEPWREGTAGDADIDGIDGGGVGAGRGSVEDALAFLVLRLVGRGATPQDVADRLGGFGVAITGARAEELFGRLVQLGLARVVSADGMGGRFVVTSLGQALVGAPLDEPSELVRGLEELERLRTDLLSTIAHEIRTPLTAVRTCIGLLRDPDIRPDPEQYARLLATIGHSADRMQHLVEDVLDLARLRAGRVRLQLRRLDGRTLVREVTAPIAPLADARGQRLRQVLPDVPVWVYGDRRRLEQALMNLASNAQKFAPEHGNVTIGVAAVGDEVRWTVEDDGPGIPAADQERLFERFFVGTSARGGPGGGGPGGVGLGLPMALQIAQAHGGGIAVRSRPGEGSAFTLWVPAAGPEESDAS